MYTRPLCTAATGDSFKVLEPRGDPSVNVSCAGVLAVAERAGVASIEADVIEVVYLSFGIVDVFVPGLQRAG